jgi:restriction endonuclease S subunit
MVDDFEKDLCNGTTYPRFKAKDLCNLQIPIPKF